MNDYFDILPIGFHIGLLSLYAIGIQMGPFARERLSPTIESPLIWKTKNPTFWFYLLVWEDSFFLNFNWLLAVYLSFSGLWWYGLIYAIELLILASVIVNIYRAVINFKTNANNVFTFKSLGLVGDIITIGFLISFLPTHFSLFGWELQTWIFLGIAAIKPIFMIILNLVNSRTSEEPF
jgi:hypothetical protein